MIRFPSSFTSKRICLGFLIAASAFNARVIAQVNPEIPRDTSYNVRKVYNQIKKNFPYATPAIDEVPAAVVAERNVVYATLANTPFGKRDLHADIFRPAKKGKYPAVIMVHGGGWRSGDKSMQVPMAEMLAAKGFVTIPVEYQLSLEATYPAAVHNIKAAVRWIKANASRYNIDTAKVAISGCSAGGQLASLVGLTNGVEKFEGTMGTNTYSSAVQAIIDFDGAISFMAPSSLNSTRSKNSPDVQWLGGLFAEKPEIWKEASPGYWATERSVPMLFLNSGLSRFHAGQDELIGQLKEWGIYHEVYKFNVNMHPFWLFHPWADESVNYMADFLDKVFKKPAK
ncbi:alpha/beta hydrolase [Desertivirga arenae]|uniref:alpha/beta hydrolase n=1 Tax=Desertivirga arenae TaxID=2810309 RepID=UPI001A97D08B|nr:alpha/beta hydrolase [Pedobacter sp. SYSU D00823]